MWTRSVAATGLATEDGTKMRGTDIIAAIKSSGVEFVVSVPDIVTSEHLLRPIAADPDLRLVRVCKEDEGISICAALSFCERRAMLLIQNTGLLDSINALRAIGMEYEQPVCIMVGLQGKEPDRAPEESAKYGVRIVVPVLSAMGVDHYRLRDEGDIARIPAMIDEAYSRCRPVVFLLDGSPA